MRLRPSAPFAVLLPAFAWALSACVVASDDATLARSIWRLQLEVLNEQSAKPGGRDNFRISTHYLGWPPGAPEPLASDDFRSWIAEEGDESYECSDFTLTGFTQSTDTALLFWNTRCSAMGDGGDSFHYASAAVWVLSDAGWQLFAHLGRRKPGAEARRFEEAASAAEFPAFPSGLFASPAPVITQPSARDLLWDAEQEILAARGRNDFGPYLSYASERYLAWPPNVTTPMNVATLRRMIDAVTGLEKERKTHRFAGYSQAGGTAVVYWHTHRTRTRAGETVDQHNATTGVWSYENSEWRLLGVLSRPKSPQELAVRSN